MPVSAVRLAFWQRLHEGAVLAEERRPVADAVGGDVADRPADDARARVRVRQLPPPPTRASRGSGPRSPRRAVPAPRRRPRRAAPGSSAARRTRAASRPASLSARRRRVSSSVESATITSAPGARSASASRQCPTYGKPFTDATTTESFGSLIGLAGYPDAPLPHPPPRRCRTPAAAASPRQASGEADRREKTSRSVRAEQDDRHDDRSSDSRDVPRGREAGAALTTVRAAVHEPLAHERARTRPSVPGRRRARASAAADGLAPAARG